MNWMRYSKLKFEADKKDPALQNEADIQELYLKKMEARKKLFLEAVRRNRGELEE